MKNAQFILLALVGAGVGLAVFSDKKIKPKNPKEEELDRQFPLVPSPDFNPLVKVLQQNIINYGLPVSLYITTTGGADGIYGSGVRNALRFFNQSPEQITFDEYAKLNKRLNDGFKFSDLF